MDEGQKKEYQSIVLGALLHDIGKLMQKPEGRSITHPEDGGKFLSQYEELISNIGFDFKLVDNIVRFHQHGKYEKEITEPRQKNLAAIVAASDRFASGERDYEKEIGGDSLGYNSLDPVFSYIDLMLDQETDVVKNYNGKNYHYKHEILSFTTIFPSHHSLPEAEGTKELIKANYEQLKSEFKNDFEKLLIGINSINSPNQKMNTFLVLLESLLYKYTWCIPDDVGRQIRDISLFDHTRISAAISACLYIYHYKDNSLDDIRKLANDETQRFFLIEGDLSGIQDYLYNIANVGIGGVAKRLRTRSFFLQTLVETVSHRVLHGIVGDEIELPLVCKIMSSGGNFIILAPKVEGTEDRLMKINKELNEWLFKEFQGDLSFSIASIPIRGTDFEIKRPSHESYITRKLIDLHELLEGEKSRKLFYFLTSSDNNSFTWNENNFIWRDKYFPYGDCPSCKKNPAKLDKGLIDERLCERCDSDRRFSESLIKAKYVCYAKERLTTNKDNVYEFFNGTEKYWVTIAKNEIDMPFNAHLIQSMDPAHILYDKPIFFNPYANYVSHFRNREDLDICCKNFCGKDNTSFNECEFYKSITDTKFSDNKNIKPSGFPAVKPFDCLAASSDGEKLLGIMKADVDRLGIIFNAGLGKDRRSLSRIATLSRMLDMFFSGWIAYAMQNDEGFQETYTIYSGGDDLMLVGSWNKIVDLSIHIGNAFRNYVAHNPQITISVGIAATKSKFPIAKSSKLAGEFLKRAKEGELLKETDRRVERKNRLHLFGTTAVWFKKRKKEVDVSELMYWAKKILNAMEDYTDQRVTSGVVYNLLKFSEMCKDWLEKEDNHIEDLRYLPLMAYTIGRNIKNKETSKSLRVFIDDINKQPLFSKFRMPITWALLNYRGRRDKNDTF